MGQPVHKRYPQRMRLQRRQYGILWIFFSYIGFPKLYYFLFFSVYPLTTMLNAQDKIQSFRLSYLKNFRSSFVLLMYFIIQVFHNKLHKGLCKLFSNRIFKIETVFDIYAQFAIQWASRSKKTIVYCNKL